MSGCRLFVIDRKAGGLTDAQHIDRGFQPRPPMERGEDADDDEIERITTNMQGS